MKTDKGLFDALLGRMLAQPPKKTAQIRVKPTKVPVQSKRDTAKG